jgi:hypothetical protein
MIFIEAFLTLRILTQNSSRHQDIFDRILGFQARKKAGKNQIMHK